MDVIDHARSRSDGTFEIYISSPDLDARHHVVLDAMAGDDLDGRIVVPLEPGETREDIAIELGAGMRVRGVVIDEHGAPLEGVTVGPEDYGNRSAPTDARGQFEITLGPQGRYPLHVFSGRSELLAAPPGHLAPSIDVDAPDGSLNDVRITVQRDRWSRRPPYFTDLIRNGYVDVGAEIDGDHVVRAVGNELAAAGLRVNDLVVGTDPPSSDPSNWYSNMVMQGQTMTFKVKRDGEQLDIRVTAPHFGARR